MKKILVTGGCGFFGRHLIKKLLDSGNLVYCVDNIIQGGGGIYPTNWPLFNPLEYHNFREYFISCESFFDTYKDDDFDYVFHLAAVVGGRETIENDPLAVAYDLVIDSLFWKWVSEVKPKKTIYFSSSAVYPVSMQGANWIPLLEKYVDFENCIDIPDMSYGYSKLTGEYLARLVRQKYGLNIAIYRPFSGYGEDQHDNYPFPAICKRAINHREGDFVVWGTGDQIRDFIHIDDCVEGVLQTMDKIDDANAVNLSTGIGTTFKEFAGIVLECVGKKVTVVGNTNKPSGVFARIGDTAKQKALGFSYKTDFKTGIKKSIEYYLRNYLTN